MAKKDGRSRPERSVESGAPQIAPPLPVPTPAVVKFTVSRKTQREVEAVRRWESRSVNSDLVLSGRLREEHVG